MHLKHGQKVVLAVLAILLVLAYLSRNTIVPYEGMSVQGASGGPSAEAAVKSAPGALAPEEGVGSAWAATNPATIGSPLTAGPNFLSAGAHIGVNSVGQSKRNSSYDLRSTPPNPKVQVSPWLNSTIEPGASWKGIN